MSLRGFRPIAFVLTLLLVVSACGDDSSSSPDTGIWTPLNDAGQPYSPDSGQSYPRDSGQPSFPDTGQTPLLDSGQTPLLDSGQTPLPEAGPIGDAASDTGSEVGTPADCEGIAHGSLQERTMYESASVASGTPCKSEIQTRVCNDGTFTEWSGTFTADSCAVENPADCGNSAHGSVQERTRYEDASVASGEQCVSETQTRTCNDGSWTEWSGTFDEEECTVGNAENCVTGDEQHRARYENATVPYDENCISEEQTRTCTEGVWSEWSGSYTLVDCTKDSPADCDGTVHGAQKERTRYENETVPYGSECVPEVQYSECDNGTWLDWTGSFEKESCSTNPPADCDDVEHGGETTRIRFETETVSAGQSCNFEEQTGTCNNGTWVDWTGTFEKETCTVEGTTNCEEVFPHGFEQERIRYENETVQFDQSCVSEQQTRQCDNGTWTEWDGEGDFQFETCTVLDAAPCGDKPHGEVETRIRWKDASVGPDETCVSQEQTRDCYNGTWTEWSANGEELFIEETCEVQDYASCGDTPHGAHEQRTRYEYASVPYNETCVSEEQTRECNDGTWTEWEGDGAELFTEEECEPAELVGSCEYRADDFCIEYTGTGHVPVVVRAYCLGYDRDWDPGGPCPSANRVGSCVVEKGTPDQSIFVFYPWTYNASSAEEECDESDGIWVP